ncbi:aldose 1-epimerase family protein [Cronobacter turicensis]|nr:aldose 1-epimerase family protein [Cronobacter turicensis]EKY3212555.1 aldose 1-epimerase family protein [Cronobacter turicensis]EKY3216060.1 aldose 1-epimerase family protein [Cronobacter turicensis]
MNWTLENSRFRLEIAPVGAELRHWWDARCQRDWIWQPRDGIWMHSATQLFPVVGRLLHGGLRDNGAFYPLPDHGFLRHRPFTCLAQRRDRLHLMCEADDVTTAVWPFRWRMHIFWTLNDCGLAIRWRVENTDQQPFGFSLGWHPGFALPVASEPGWTAAFDKNVRGPFAAVNRTLHIPDAAPSVRRFVLESERFSVGAHYFECCTGQTVKIVSPRGVTALTLQTDRQRWLALWGVPGADLLCIEPLAGTTDAPDFNGEQRDKRGIVFLAPGQCYQHTVDVTLAADGA